MWSPETLALTFLTVLGVALGGIAGGYLVIGLLGMLLNKELSLGEFLVWTLAFLGLMVTAIASHGTPLFYVLILFAVGLGLGPPLTSWLADHLGTQRLRVTDLESYLRGTQERPDIPYNYRKVGDLYFESHDWARAVEWYEQALKLHDDPHVSFMLRKARERLALGKGTPILCLCGRLNRARASHCQYCGASLPGSHELLVALGAGRGRLLLLLIAVGLLSGGMALTLLRTGLAAFNVLLLLLGVGAALLYFYTTQAIG